MNSKLKTLFPICLAFSFCLVVNSQSITMKTQTTIPIGNLCFSEDDNIKTSIYDNYIIIVKSNNNITIINTTNSNVCLSYSTNNDETINGYSILKDQLFLIQNGCLITIDLNSGKQESRKPIPDWSKDQDFYGSSLFGSEYQSPIIILPNGIIAFGSSGGNFFKGWSGNIFRYNTIDKTFLNTIKTQKGVENPLAYVNGTLFFGYRSAFQAMDPITGKFLWSIELDKNQYQSAPVFHDNLIIIQNGEAPAGAGPGMMGGGHGGDGYLTIIDIKTGLTKWKFKIKNYGHPVIQNNHIATTSWKFFGGNRFKGFDLITGKELWDYSDYKNSFLVAAGGHFYVAGTKGFVHELSPETGQITGKLNLPGKLIDIISQTPSRIITVARNDNNVYFNLFSVPEKTLSSELAINSSSPFTYVLSKNTLIIIKSGSPNKHDATATFYSTSEH